MIRTFRELAPQALLGVKLGDYGALLSDADDHWIPIRPITPPGPVIDTTGAGDFFYAGLIAGLLAGLSVADAGRIGAAAGACCVTGVGASSGLREFKATAELAGVKLV
ncbi:MAG: PfkB family carbohydrate kinase [Pirellulaceae bacterium]|jgi:sugar/nucleoside kinase (ribokinase family)|nr:PfkB family carbohydrate kinase [Pirellulaceae bacterium]HJN13487.1 PfkB family carbohydrate kinase [Pirellulaceae bacterium]